MIDEKQTEVRAAWLYFMEGLTQAEIARRLGTTRLRINRILVDARRNGLVGITLNSELASCVALEQEFIRDFRLKAAVIVPTPADEEQVPMILGRATANFVSRYLENNRIRGFGIGWGRTLREMTRHIRAGRYPDLCVNSMMGGLTRGLEINTFDIVRQFIDERGHSIDHVLKRRALALPLDDLSDATTVVFAAGGAHKVRAIAAVLRGGLGSVLVCDETTARAAAALARKGN